MTQETSPQITLCIPVLNEQAQIPELLKNISSYFGKFLIPYEVVFSLDPSTDQSEKILMEESEKDPRIRVLKNPRRLGRAESLRQALLQARAPYIASASADLSTPLGDITKLLQHLTETQSKIIFGTRVDKKDSPFFTINTKKNSLEITHINILWESKRLPFKDPFSSYFVMTKEVQADLLKDLSPKGWYLTSDLQKAVLKKNISYSELPIHSTAGRAANYPYLREYLRLFIHGIRRQ